jgi:Mce-associated membrane protein
MSAPSLEGTRPESVADTRPDAGPPRRARRIPVLAVVLVLLSATALLLAVLQARTSAQAADYRSPRVGPVTRDGRLAIEAARGAALTSAVADVKVLLSYDATSLDRDLARGKAVTTGQFSTDYAQQFTTFVKPTATQYKVSVSATVVSSAVESSTQDTAVVLLFVDQTTKSSQLAAPRIDQNRVRLTMTRTPRGWLISDVAAL